MTCFMKISFFEEASACRGHLAKGINVMTVEKCREAQNSETLNFLQVECCQSHVSYESIHAIYAF